MSLALLILLVAMTSYGQFGAKGLIYLQGDNNIPFYVKLNGTMQPRYGKNHSIVSGIPAGTHDIEILFQQNKQSSLHFTVQVHEDSPLTYLLYGQSGNYSLFDLYSKKYIQPDKK